MIDTVILDFHGTLTDHNKRITESIRIAGERVGMQGFAAYLNANVFDDRRQSETLENYINRKAVDIGFGLNLDEFIKVVIEVRNEIYLPVDGLKETFDTFKRMGTRILILSNGTVKNEDAAAIATGHPSYSYIIWDKLIEWGLYTGEEGDVPLIISLKDDCRFLNKSETIAKPHPLVERTVISSIVTCLGGDYDPERTILVGDYDDDVEMARMLGCYCAYFLKGNTQLKGGIELKFGNIPQSYRDHLLPLYNIRELPFICYMSDLSREVIYDEGTNSLGILGKLADQEYALTVLFSNPAQVVFEQRQNSESRMKLA